MHVEFKINCLWRNTFLSCISFSENLRKNTKGCRFRRCTGITNNRIHFSSPRMPCHFWLSHQLILVGANLLCIALTNRILKRDEKTFSWFEIPRLPQNPLTLSQFCESSFISVPIDLKWNVWTPNFWKFIAVTWTERRFLCCQCCQSPEDIFLSLDFYFHLRDIWRNSFKSSKAASPSCPGQWLSSSYNYKILYFL